MGRMRAHRSAFVSDPDGRAAGRRGSRGEDEYRDRERMRVDRFITRERRG